MYYSAEAPLLVTYDEGANAAYIEFSRASEHRTIPIRSGKSVVAILSVDSSGILLGLELLNARLQIPAAMLESLTRTSVTEE